MSGEPFRIALDFVLADVPSEHRVQFTTRFLFELEKLYAAVGTPCPRWVTRTRAELAAQTQCSAVIGESNDEDD